MVWCGRPSQSLWQALLLAGSVGFSTALGIHAVIGYLDLIHLAPAILGFFIYVLGMILVKPSMFEVADDERNQSAGGFDPPPKLSELGLDLLVISRTQRWFAVVLPFLLAGIYFLAAASRHWMIAIAALFYLSFFTYGSTSHDLVHRNLGLSRTVNEVFLTLVELLALRSGHAYRKSHMHHHASYPAEDDLEAAASKKSFNGALLEGVTYHLRLWWWALDRSGGFERVLIILEQVLAFGLTLWLSTALRLQSFL